MASPRALPDVRRGRTRSVPVGMLAGAGITLAVVAAVVLLGGSRLAGGAAPQVPGIGGVASPTPAVTAGSVGNGDNGNGSGGHGNGHGHGH